MLVSTSILSIEKELPTKVISLNETDTDYIHLDVMDGKFVTHKTVDYTIYKNFLKKPLDIHLMVDDVPTYIDYYASLKPEFITFHIEVNTNIKKLIDMIHKKGIKVGISLNPETPVSFLVPYLKEIDLVLIMSVKPGKGGQTFLESATSKIQFLNKMRQAGSYSYMIEVDGGINDVTKHQCAGADMLVAGSFITNYDNYQRQINKLR